MRALKTILVGTMAFVSLSIDVSAKPYSQMSCYELWYARNSIFASEGYCFTTDRAIRTFGRRCYPPYGRLNAYEANQVDLIKSWERRKGCRGGYSTTGVYPPPPPQPPLPPTQVQPPPPPPPSIRYARVVGVSYNDDLAIRTGPSTRYPRVGGIPPNATGVEVFNCYRRWCRVRYGNLVGWSYSGYLSFY